MLSLLLSGVFKTIALYSSTILVSLTVHLWPISVNLKRWLSYDYSAVAFLWFKYNTCARGKEGTYFQSVIITIGFLSHRSKSRDGIFLLFK